MPKIEAKQVIVEEIKEKLARAQSVVLVNGRGLTVEQDTNLRRKLRQAGVDYKVYKNTMLEFAVKGTQFEGLIPFLKGPTTVAFSYGEAVTAAKVISGELKGMPKLSFKGGYIDGVVYDDKGMVIVANIPSREVLLSKLLGSFKAPMSTFARVIKQVAEKDAPAPAAE